MVRVTVDAVEGLHNALLSSPNVEGIKEHQPANLKVTLMDHQTEALSWLLWRETQSPPGGILGKFLLLLVFHHRDIFHSRLYSINFCV